MKNVRPDESSPQACILTQLMTSTQVFMAAGSGRVVSSRRKTSWMRASRPMCQLPTVPRPSARAKGSTRAAVTERQARTTHLGTKRW